MPETRSRLSSRGAAGGMRLLFALAVLAVGAGLWVHQGDARSRLALAAAWSENHALKLRQEALRAELLEALEPGRQPDLGRERRRWHSDQGRGST